MTTKQDSNRAKGAAMLQRVRDGDALIDCVTQDPNRQEIDVVLRDGTVLVLLVKDVIPPRNK